MSGSSEEFADRLESRWRSATHHVERALTTARELLPEGSNEAHATLAAAIVSDFNSYWMYDALGDIQNSIDMK
jgi:hypothetical protein